MKTSYKNLVTLYEALGAYPAADCRYEGTVLIFPADLGIWLTVPHVQLILEAIPKAESSQARRYRGYISVDDLVFKVSHIIADLQ